MTLVVKGKKAMCECIGSFFFILTIALSCAYAGRLAPIPIGFMLMTQVFTFGYISGGHFNPAVTFGILLVGQIKARRAFFYVIAQVIGGLIAGLVSASLLPPQDTVKVNPPAPHLGLDKTVGGGDVARAFFAEMIFTACLVTVVLHVACSRQRDNNHYGMAIGMSVLGAAFSVGTISGGSFNPAVFMGLCMHACLHDGECNSFRYAWLYWLAPLLGSALAAGMFAVVHALEIEEEDEEPDDETMRFRSLRSHVPFAEKRNVLPNPTTRNETELSGGQPLV